MPCYTPPSTSIKLEQCEAFINKGYEAICKEFCPAFFKRNKAYFQRYKKYCENKDNKALVEELHNYAKRYSNTPTISRVFYEYIKALPKKA